MLLAAKFRLFVLVEVRSVQHIFNKNPNIVGRTARDILKDLRLNKVFC